ncbi:ciliogenesis-associated TTC17-interacting protein isoform X5 [Saimiri boliviensis]|uniref:ciliogenesis-associated TTC17-interacting protein isoform X5 n=1 Tax=Saimiri boliviensis TaxID=27679 RepID=UPI003D780C64
METAAHRPGRGPQYVLQSSLRRIQNRGPPTLGCGGSAVPRGQCRSHQLPQLPCVCVPAPQAISQRSWSSWNSTATSSSRFLTPICSEQEVKTAVTSFPWSSIKGFVSEAANLVLLRVMAWRRMVPSNARFLALDTEGKLCYSTYQDLGFQTIQVDQKQAEVFIVEQTVHSEEGIPMSCQYYLLSDGHLAKRIQVGSPGCCIITKMPLLREVDEIEPRPVFEKKPLVWEEDMELYTKFLERKEELRLGHASYLRQHPEAHALISDFLLFLLLRQPQDVVTFAAEFFGPFDPRRPSTPGLGSSNRPSPFRSLEPEGDAGSGAS